MKFLHILIIPFPLIPRKKKVNTFPSYVSFNFLCEKDSAKKVLTHSLLPNIPRK
jgi:hypothetical protein